MEKVLEVVHHLFPQHVQYLIRTRNEIEQVRATYLFRGAGSTSGAFDRWGMVQNGVGWSTAGVRGNLAAALRQVESEVKFAAAFASGTRRCRVVALIGEPP